MKKRRILLRPAAALLACYGGCVLIRFILALLTSAFPLINIDEFLYYGIARSIASGEGILFRGQPANYAYILYPLTLTPVYGLGLKGAALYRALQLWNILLSSLSVFPLYCLANRLTQNRQKALGLACAAMLLPDFMLGQLMMAENVILPLFYTLMAVAARYGGSGADGGRWQDALWAGLLGGLLFAAKPGAAIPAVVLFAAWCLGGLMARNKARALWPLCGLAVGAAAAGCFFLLLAALGGEPSLLSIYDVQVADAKHLDVFARFLCVYPAYLALAGGLGALLLIADSWKGYDRPRKTLLRCVLLSLAATIIGVSWAVNRYEYNTNTAHLRYIGMYLPLLLFFAYASAEEAETGVDRGKKQALGSKLPLIGLCAAVLTLLLIPGVYAGANEVSAFAENMTLASVIQAIQSGVSPWVYLVLAAALCGVSLALIWRLSREKARRAITLLCCVCMAVNGACAYGISVRDTKQVRADEAKRLWEQLGDSEPLYLYTKITTTSYYAAFDAYSPRDISYVSLNDLFNQLYSAKGVYRPYLPKGERGNIASRLTPDTDTLVMDPTVYCMLQLSDNTTHWTADENALHLVKIKDPDKPWLDSVIGNTANTFLDAGKTGILLVFNPDYLASALTVRMTLYCETDTSLQLYSNRERKTIQLEAGMHEYEVTFDRPTDAYNLQADQTVRFCCYSLYNP